MTREIKHYISGPKAENSCMYWVEMSTLLTAVLPPGRQHIPLPKGNVSINTVICNMKWYDKSMNLTLSWPAGHMYMCHLQRVFLKSAGITLSHFFSMLPSTLKYFYSAEPVRMLPAAIVAGSCNGVTYTRCCRYSCLRSWWWVVVPTKTYKAVSRYNILCNDASCWIYIGISTKYY
jgi:hypothetical protein